MSLGYDIFKTLEDGSPMWVMQVSTLEEAKKGVQALAGRTVAEYFVRDASSGEIIIKLGPIQPLHLGSSG
jgi:hypothetical protein